MPSDPADPTPTSPSSSDDPAVADLIQRLGEGLGGAAPAAEPSDAQVLARLDALLGTRSEAPTAPADQARTDTSPATGERASTRSAPSALVDFGTDLTARAKEAPPAFFGREEEIDTVLEALCRRRKANPLLLGPPGSGKTALVEALAARIASGAVPPVLKDQRVIAINTGTLIAGSSMVGEIEARIDALLREAAAPDVVLFFDEVHSLMGAGGKEGTGDVASLLKPALARGDIRCIAATTDDEYHRFIQNDSALERRFLPIRLRALTAHETRQILTLLRDQDASGPNAPDRVLDLIVEIAGRMLPNRHFPDKAIDLFDQVTAFARLRDVSQITDEIVETVAERIAGVPASPSARLERLGQTLREGSWCSDDHIDAVLERLSITLRGLDISTERPNLVADVVAPSLERLRAFAALLAVSLYGDERRVIEIDGATLGSEAALTSLIGATAGYVGYGDRHLLAALAEQPCHVIIVHSIDEAHPQVRELLTQATDSGWVVDQRRKRIPFSESVLLRWSEPADAPPAIVGFSAMSRRPTRHADTKSDADVTIVLGSTNRTHRVLDALANRWLELEGIRLEWSPSLIAWVDAHAGGEPGATRWVDQHVTTPLWRLLGSSQTANGSAFAVDVRNDQVVVDLRKPVAEA